MKDKEGNRIQLVGRVNAHILVLGQSGQGKSYYCCRRIENAYKGKQKILILDYSGSYTKQELKKQDFQYEKQMKYLNPFQVPFEWGVKGTNENVFQKDLVDALTESLSVHSYIQKTLLDKAIKRNFQTDKEWSFQKLFHTMYVMLYEKKKNGDEEIVKEEIKNLSYLLERLSPFEDITNFSVKLSENQMKESECITVLELSDFPERQRKILVEIILSLYWKQLKRGGIKDTYNVCVLDEFQFLNFQSDSTVSCMLREGRKFGIEMLMSSQFLRSDKSDQKNTLQQAGNISIFKPTLNERKNYANLIDPEQSKEWQRILKNLQVGEAVIVGSYRIEGQRKIWTRPIVCRIE